MGNPLAKLLIHSTRHQSRFNWYNNDDVDNFERCGKCPLPRSRLSRSINLLRVCIFFANEGICFRSWTGVLNQMMCNVFINFSFLYSIIVTFYHWQTDVTLQSSPIIVHRFNDLFKNLIVGQLSIRGARIVFVQVWRFPTTDTLFLVGQTQSFQHWAIMFPCLWYESKNVHIWLSMILLHHMR